MVGCNLGDIWKNVFSVCELTQTNAQVVAVHTGDFDIFLMSAWDLKTRRVSNCTKSWVFGNYKVGRQLNAFSLDSH